MPVHDWTRVRGGGFHAFHQNWIIKLADALNAGGLPDDFEAIPEPVSGSYIPDVLTLRVGPAADPGRPPVAASRPSARQVLRVEQSKYLRRASRVVVRLEGGQVVAIIELVSPGNKGSRRAIKSFVDKSADILDQGINLLVVDLHPPTPRDPQGVHKLIMDQFDESQPFEFLPDKPLTVASYVGGDVIEAYVDTVGVGDPLPSAPLFLTPVDSVPCPLESTYQQAWANLPRSFKAEVDPPAAPKE